MPREYEAIRTEVVGRVAVLTLHNPERMNALSGRMSEELREAVLEFDTDDNIGAFVLTGAGRAFCAGADVKGWGNAIAQGEAGNDMERRARETRANSDESWTELWQRVKPVVIAYNGDSVGAGLTITLGADYRIASERARLSMRFARMGVTPELQSSRLLPQITGLSKALDMMLTGELFPAEKALAYGLVDEVVPHEDLMQRATTKAAQYAKLHPETTRAVKQLVHANLFEPETTEVKLRERTTFATAQRTFSHKEAVQAFIEKREPDFYTGRPATP